MIRLGIAIQESWNFFNEIFTDLEKNYQTTLLKIRSSNLPIFTKRVNNYLFRHDLTDFMKKNEVVFFEWSSLLLVAATRLPKVCGMVTRLHRYEMYEWVNHINWDHVDKIILVSQAKKREFVTKFPDQEHKVIVSSPSTSLDKYSPKPKKFNGDIGILCNLTPRKRVYDFILNFYELNKTTDNFHLHIAGGMDPSFKDYYEALQYIVRELNLQDKVTFYGNVTDTPNWYRKIDIFISNSYSEGLQVAPMEAMASGCFCLSHRWDGAEELLPPENLYFSGKELREKIMQYCEMPEARKSAEKARMRAIACEKFDIRQTISQIRQAIDEVAKTPVS
ncbi:MAG: glycosyltransferase family 4 protein [Anaerolineales bacterium]